MKKKIKLGLIGLSKGNGHPYSWSAIINGYDKRLMSKCGFPAIPKYLEKKNFSDNQIKGAEVTHIWTQDLNISNYIAKTTFISKVVKNYKDLLGNVDAILLARDDAENHVKYSKPFLENNLPIYIDKPIAFTVKNAKKLFSLQKYDGQIFSCSALRYSKHFQLNKKQKKKIGQIISIHAFVPKDWDKYSVHVIDPILAMIPNLGTIKEYKKIKVGEQTMLSVKYKNSILLSILSTGQNQTPINIRIIGKKGLLDLFPNDTYNCFKNALNNFISGIKNKQKKISTQNTLKIIKLIEIGR